MPNTNWYEQYRDKGDPSLTAPEDSEGLSSSRWGFLRVKDIAEIYALEYKISELKRKAEGGYFSDDLNVYYQRLQDRANRLCDELLPKLIQIFEAWIIHHGVYVDVVEEKEEVDLGDPEVSIPKQVLDISNALTAANSGAELEDKFFAINWAIHMIHYTEQSMVGLGDKEWIPDLPKDMFDTDTLIRIDDYSVQESESFEEWDFLRDLSEGKFIPEWQEQMRQRAAGDGWCRLARRTPRSWGILSGDDVESVYELEYKISELEQKMNIHGELSDEDYLYSSRKKKTLVLGM